MKNCDLPADIIRQHTDIPKKVNDKGRLFRSQKGEFTMSSTTTPKEHKLTDKHPVLSAILFALGGFVLISIVSYVVSTIFKDNEQSTAQCMTFLSVIITSLLIGLAYKRKFRLEFEGAMTGGRINIGFMLILIQVGYSTLVSVIKVFDDSVFHMPTAVSILAALQAGVMEEILYRGMMISTVMRKWKQDENKVIPAAVICSAVFGGAHLMNAVAAPLDITLLQVVVTFCSGIFFSAVYLRSGNIVPIIAGHFYHDFVEYVISKPDSSESLVMSGDMSWSDWTEICFTVILAFIGIWLLRKEKRSEIKEIWEKKWSV